ncbi:hemolysin III family protein [Branchiibius sp. NY16-3462-2]|uniref:PAQR family membrane homeostasis protein TrhA n=1 Tax=Branchiibius sp. NY16-3462-2 TaxID=1807500 RepID=UPI00079B5581|nr:hemolysin III family protein [Branchiibius sp. NY16-3462-2]KYH45365.1 DNA-binding protein [Branchiibius sp. NY16-3462-2]
MSEVREGVRESIADAREDAKALLESVKPKLRGWLHLVMAPLALIAGIVLIAISKTTAGRVGAIVFTITAVLLFGTSAIYHRGNWSPRTAITLRRMDHANIFLIIAGTYTPFALTLLPAAEARSLLILVWSGALLGVCFRVFWTGAPRWLYVPVYLALGWVAVFYIKPMLHGGGPAVLALIITGGALYSIGAIIYGTKRPNPSPRWFGFHEIFHTFTILAFAVHYVAASLAVTGHDVTASTLLH